MTRRDWWFGVVLLIGVIALGFAIQTAMLIDEHRAAHAPGVRRLASVSS